jgi:hypothetical protein
MPLKMFTFLRIAVGCVIFLRAGLAAEWKIAVSDREIRCTWPPGVPANIGLRELPLHTGETVEPHELWKGEGAAGHARVPRFDGARDRLYAKFELFGAADGKALGAPQCVTDFSALPQRKNSLGSSANKKGVTCVLDLADVVALGAGQVIENIDIGGLLDWQTAEPQMSFEFEGRKVGLRAGYVAHLDKELSAFHAARMRVTGILLNYVAKTAPRNSPLVHPLTDPAGAAGNPAAFNTATAEGLFYYRAIVHWLAERYTREDAAYGHLGGLVIGNEVQSHWSWYHLGRVDGDVLIREYGVALRVADLATRSVHADFPIYVSLEHHWTMPASDDPQQGITGVEVLEGINATAQREGDFPWNLAHHPYPQDLGEPRFWNDTTAPLRLDAPRVTFHNLEVLPAFLSQPRFLYAGRMRRIALTEQGFHCKDSSAGAEDAQAAAFALAWKKVQALPSIESFLYHRHVDHPHEFGLHCGIREHDGSSNIGGIGRARKIWDVLQKAGTPEEDAAFAFALPIIGRKDWKNLIGEVDTKPAPPEPTVNVVFDFVAKRREVQLENTLALEVRHIARDRGLPVASLQQHPNQKGISRATWRLTVPAKSAALTPALTFQALLNHAESRGAAFAVKIDNDVVWQKQLAATESAPANLDLAKWAGREVAITFEIDPLTDNVGDWATWVQPRVIIR